MRYLIDTNIWIIYLKNVETKIRTRFEITDSSEIAVCSVVWAELLHGAQKYGDPAQREARVEATLQPFATLPFDLESARHYARTRAALERAGKIIGGTPPSP